MSAPNLKHGQVMAQIVVAVYEDNALGVSGNLEDPLWAIAALENAIDAIRNNMRPLQGGLAIPGRDVSLPEHTPKVVIP